MTLLWVVGALAATILVGIIYQVAGDARDQRTLLPPGKLVDCAGSRLHLRCTGAGKGAVFLEAGIAASSLSWSHVQPRLAAFTRVCSYDRAGLGWSPRCAGRLGLERLLADMNEVMRAAYGSERVVLVGHSFGGLLVRLFAARYPERVAALVLVDPALVSEWHPLSQPRARMLAKGVSLSRRGAILARLGAVRLALDLLASGSRRLPKLIGRASSGRGSQVMERLAGEVAKLPSEVRPCVRAHWSRPRSFESMAAHLQLLPDTAKAVEASGHLGDMPLTVISGAHLTAPQLAEQEAVSRLSTRGRHVVAQQGAHWIHLDEPELVVAEVTRILLQAG